MIKKFSFLIAIFSIFILAGCGETPIETFSVSGKVMCGDAPIANVRVISDIAGEVTTNEGGEFTFEGLTSAMQISCVAEGYVFVKSKISVFGETANLIIKAEKTYLLNGRVTSSNIGVAGASVEIIGLTPMTVRTNSNGYFSATVAGPVTVRASKSGYVFADKEASITNSEITISGTTDVEATVEGASGAVLMLNSEPMTENAGVYSAQNVSLGSVITPVLEGYHFEPSSYTILSENATVKFTAYALYSVSGRTVSGDVAISDVEILLNGASVAQSDSNGNFTVQGLWAGNSIAFAHSIYQFNSKYVSTAVDLGAIEGAFSMLGKVVCGTDPLKGVRVSLNGGAPIPTGDDGAFAFDKIAIGAVISFEKDGYKIDNYVVTQPQNVLIHATEYYNAKVTVYGDNDPLGDAVISIAGVDAITTNERGVAEFYQCLDDFDIVVTKAGYTTSASTTISRQNNEISIYLDTIYTLNITVHSGDIVLNNAIVTVNNIDYDVDATGTLAIQDCVKSLTIEVTADGYTSESMVINKDNATIDCDLGYVVTGSVLNGDLDVDATVTATTLAATPTQKSVSTENGYFELVLHGQNTITITAEGLDYTPQDVTHEAELTFDDARYSISGALSSDGAPVAGATVSLVGDTTREIVTTESGTFGFDNLSGQYTLITNNDQGIVLRPSYYIITRGGTYDFDASGYSVSGNVTCGGVALSGVTVKAGDAIATTDEKGDFVFDLITGEVQLSAIKTGYTFNTTYNITPEDNGNVFAFEATYRVEGRVICGSAGVAGVEIVFGDNDAITTDTDGRFTLSGLAGEYAVTVYKAGYAFSIVPNVDGYINMTISATMTVGGTVMLGDNPLAGVTVSNGAVSAETNASGEFTLSGVVVGDTLTATKTGYKFRDAVIITEYGMAINFGATYDLVGTVKSAGVAIEGVVVRFGELEQTTTSLGQFAFRDLEIVGEITFVKSGYDFAPIEIDGPIVVNGATQDLNVVAVFAINGRVTIGGAGLGGVVVSTDNKSATTDADGYYTLGGLSTTGWLTVSKEGYDFAGDFYYNGAGTLDFTATYYVRFSVNCGDADMGEAVVTTSARLEQLGNNVFVIRGLVGPHIFDVNAETKGFDSVQRQVTGYEANMVIELTYSVTLRLDTPLDGVVVTFSDSKNNTNREITFDNGVAILSNLYGRGEWSVSRENYLFLPAEGTFSLPKTVAITPMPVYTISGKVTSGAVGVSGMTVRFGNLYTTQTAVTDQNGAFTLTNLVGSSTLKGTLEAPNCDTVSVTISNNVSGEGTFNYSLDNQTYAFWIFQKGYQNLRDNPYGYKIEMTKGDVSPDKAGMQHAYGIRIKDKNGVYLIENKNYGDPVLGIDPRVSMTAYFDPSLGGQAMQYKFIKHKENGGVSWDGSKVNTDYSVKNFASTTRSDFTSSFGIDVMGFYAYNIQNSATYLKSCSDIKKSGNNLSFTLELQTSDEVLGNYKKQMNALSGQSPKFTSVKITYTYDLKGNLLKTKIEEVYKVTQVIEVTIKGEMEETITAFNENTNYVINKADYGN